MLVVLLIPSRAAACSYMPATFETVADAAELVVVGRVDEVSDSATYDVRVERWLRGTSPNRLDLSGIGSPDPSSCDPSLEVGSSYVFGMESIDEPLHLQNVWFMVESGSLSADFFEPPVDTVAELDLLLASTPQTNLPPPITPVRRLPVLPIAGLALLLGAGLIWRSRGRTGPAIR